MTNVEVFGKIKHIEDKIYLEVERSYKNQSGVIEKDLLLCRHWSNMKRNVFNITKDDTLVIVKGRLESENGVSIIIVEEFRPI